MLIKVTLCLFAIRNKLIDLLTELKGFVFVTTLTLEFKIKI